MRFARPLTALVLMLSVAQPVSAQTAPAAPVLDRPRYDPAPWWMRDPIIAASGYVELKLPANRANFSASFQAVEKTAGAATAQPRRRSGN
jgi:hypothetical protein